jgi:hypothetical protein
MKRNYIPYTQKGNDPWEEKAHEDEKGNLKPSWR